MSELILVGPKGRPQTPPDAVRRLLDSLGELNTLQRLTISQWDLRRAPRDIRRLGALEELKLPSLGLTEIPDWICELTKLRLLSVASNPISTIAESTLRLSALEELDVSGCNIQDVSARISELTRLKTLDLARNPVQSPPIEIVRQGLDAVHNYWQQSNDTGVDHLYEAKLIILGEAGAGKTSFARKFLDPTYTLRDREPSTEGIEVMRGSFPTSIHPKDSSEVLARDFQVNIWDFGGQEIYHATHQFFLTRRSVYALVCDDRKEDTDFGYWLEVVDLLSDGSPLFIIRNEKQDRTKDVNVSKLRARFQNLRGMISTNLETNRGLDLVVQTIRRELETLPHIGVGLPATWKRVRGVLENDPRNYISLDEFLRICEHHGFKNRENSLQLSGYLHDLGIFLHFQDDAVLRNTVILKPVWGTDAVYRVLDDPGVVSAHGRFTSHDLSRIWSEEKYAGLEGELLRLMMKFQLCYALEHEEVFIAPQLLPSEQPAFDLQASEGPMIRYQYSFLPKGMMTRFIVATHHLIAEESLVWKTGVILERDGSLAEVVENYGERWIRARAFGPNSRTMLAFVDNELGRIHRSFSRLQYERHFQCSCSECCTQTAPNTFPLTALQNLAIKRRLIQCYRSGEMVDPVRLLGDVLPGALPPECTASSVEQRQVFVSYAWTEESSSLVDRLQEALEEHGIRLLRDREEVRYKDSIHEFMCRLGRGKGIVVVISDKYLKSESCMFEMLEIVRAGDLSGRIFPLVLPDANIYRATGLVGYVSYWEQQYRELNDVLRPLGSDGLRNLQANVTLYAEIRRMFDDITGRLRDMNALTVDQHSRSGFEEVVRRIRLQIGQ
ncbi:MAG: COR domain-containing protein [Bryobacteraceae bacterium]